MGKSDRTKRERKSIKEKKMKQEIEKLKEMSPFEIKDLFIKIAKEASIKRIEEGERVKVHNAGRGNPNFLNTIVREAFSYLSLFAVKIAEEHSVGFSLGLRPVKKGIAKKLKKYLSEEKGEGITFLKKALDYIEKNFSFDTDEYIFEVVDGALGDFYPMPPRIFPFVEKIVNAYLFKILGLKEGVNKRKFNLFATEGATASMIYLFHSLKTNRILKEGDKIAIFTPIFSPYLEIPILKEFGLEEVYIQASEEMDWQISDKEIEKLKDPQIKGAFLVNPTNPTSVAINDHSLYKISKLIKEERKDLIILTDTVYSTFVEEFHSLISAVPENTICVYSYSKYFGVTGWRLGVIMMDGENVVDRLIEQLPEKEKQELDKRYSMVSPEPRKLKFIERLETDSRDEALAHTGGLSCPQQILMSLFSLFELLDTEKIYKQAIQKILQKRINLLFDHLEMKAPKDKGHTYYYSLLDLVAISKEKYGEKFSRHLKEKIEPLEFLFRLAKDKLTICLPGEGFSGPKWSIRVSLANLNDEDYIDIGKDIKEVLEEFYDEWKKDR